MFMVTREPIDPAPLLAHCRTAASGALATFEGTVRNHNDGEAVDSLDYECYAPLAQEEGSRIVEEALAGFDIHEAACVHRVGPLAIGDAAVFICVSAAHRGDAFAACQYIIDEVKARVPIWKKEHYTTGDSHWIDPTVTTGGVA